MLIGHRYEHTPDGDLRIRSHNHVLSGTVLVILVMGFGIPTVVLMEGMNVTSPSDTVLALLVMLLLPAVSVVALLSFATHETLTLSWRNDVVERRRRMLLGLREQVEQFALGRPAALELRVRKDAWPAIGTLWMMLPDGREHCLSPGNAVLLPGRPSTERWLGEVADYLHVAVTRVERGAAGADARPVAPLPAWRRRAAAFNAVHAPPPRVVRKASTPNAPKATDPNDRIGLLARAVVALFGLFLAVLELSQALAVGTALFTGRLRVSGFRTGSHSYLWDERPMAFSVHTLFGVIEVLVVGYIAWQCLRISATGVIKPPK
ncbi:hypothetical protein [Stenotrophomonas rhizophila]|uniref:hypothetical protein n=1 Tax=Stenotrophomonas rhizophila TaxID=216778 RepID=UPI00112F567D|nr:hypothetical protein [Stenotrophomonas rhizophila]